MKKLTVDIIIPTYKPDKKFEKLIKCLLKQTYQVNQILVINTKSDSFPLDVVQLDSRITVKEIEVESFNHGGTRRMAAELCQEDILICMTQDAVPADQYLIEKLIQPFEDERVACTYGRQLPEHNCDVIERYTRNFNYPPQTCVKDIHSIEEMGIKTFFCSDVCAAYRRTYYEVQGGFIERAIFNEDMIMTAKLLKAGYKCVYAAEAKVVHSHNYNCIEQFKRNFDVAVSQVENPDVFGGIKSESEGIKLVKMTAAYLVKIRKPWLVPVLIMKSSFKYLGFKIGQKYRQLPQKLVVKLSSNPKYWY